MENAWVCAELTLDFRKLWLHPVSVLFEMLVVLLALCIQAKRSWLALLPPQIKPHNHSNVKKTREPMKRRGRGPVCTA